MTVRANGINNRGSALLHRELVGCRDRHAARQSDQVSWRLATRSPSRRADGVPAASAEGGLFPQAGFDHVEQVTHVEGFE